MITGRRKRFLYFSKGPDRLWDPPYSIGKGETLSPGIKRTAREA
jgi:hypothetical protein